MIDSTENRATRRSRVRRAKTAVLAGTAAAAITLGMAVGAGMPQANADINITWDPAYTAGTLAGLLNWYGNTFPGTSIGGGLYNSGPPQSAFISVDSGIGLVGQLNLTLLLKYINDSSVDNLYNTLGGIPNPKCSGSYATNCRYALELATSEATLNLAEAYRAQVQSVTTGVTPAGLIPFEASPTSTAAKPTQTNQVLGLVQNPLRPNGGFYSRFPDLAKGLGVNPEMPAAGKFKSADQKVALDTSTLDVAWAYDPTADFPAVFNLLAIQNSLSAFLPLTILTGGTTDLVLANSAGEAVTTTDLGLHIAKLLQISLATLLGPPPDGEAFYVTLASDQLPILVPARLPGIAVNALLKAVKSPYLLGNPFADAIEPALKTLINVAYTDVLPPDKLGQCATKCGTADAKTWSELGYQAYDRTYLQAATPTPFGSVEPLTPEEKKAVPGDAWNALLDGIKAQLAKPLWGILVPNPDNPPAAATSPASAVKPAAVKAAAATPAPVSAPEAPVSAPVPAPPVAVPAAPVAPPEAPSAPAVSAPAVSEPPAAVEISLPDNDPAPESAPRVGAHRGGAASFGSGKADAPKASTGHRGA